MDISFLFLLALVVVLELVAVFLVVKEVEAILRKFISSRHRSQHWYWSSKDNDNGEWKLIKDALLLKKDPLAVSMSMSNTIDKRAKIAAWVLTILSLLVVLAVVEFFPSVDKLTQYSQYLVPAAILISAMMVALGTRYTIRVHGRASSRQEWIKDVRRILAELTLCLPEPHSAQDVCQRSESEQKFRKLELHLNPSEKVHRSLLYAISLAYGADWLDDEQVEENLCLREVDDWRQSTRRKAGIVRLSQVLLKREWEKTKSLR